jgi:hypothetical protein
MIMDQPTARTRRPTPACWRQCGWLVLGLAFAVSAVIQLFLAIAETVSWPLFVAVPVAVMAACCGVCAWRQR